MTDTTTAPPPEEWEIQRDSLKSSADAHFRSKSYPAAIADYASALALDPTNHILLSNKSAAHLANGEKSKALHEARKCVEASPDWAKGYTRLGAAMASLARFGEAMKVYEKALTMDAKNAAAKAGLEECRAKEREARERKREEAEGVQRELDRQRCGAATSRETNVEETKERDAPAEEGDDLLDDFFSEVEQATEKKSTLESTDAESSGADNESSTNRIKVHLTDLGTSAQQIDRLLQTNYEWKNLNPFYVLDIPHTIDDESILSGRYRALSLLVHPDKNPDDAPRAKLAFEQVKKAMELLNNQDKRRHVRQLVEQGQKQGKRDYDKEFSTANNTVLSESQQQERLTACQTKATMKIFAEIEAKRRDVERRKRKFEQRERQQEDEEKEREKKERAHDKNWREVGRVEKRVGNWRDFQKKR